MAHATLDPDSGEVLLATAWNEKELAKAVPGSRWDDRRQVWRLRPAWSSMVTARGLFGPLLTLGDDVVDWVWKMRREVIDVCLQKRGYLEPDPWDDTPLPDGLYAFQGAGVQWMRAAGSGLLGDDMGTGKTVQFMSLLQAVLRSCAGTGEDGLPALVITPASVRGHWEKHVPRWLPQAVPYVVEGTAPKRRKILRAAMEDPNAIVFVNLEAIRLFSRLAPYGSVKLKRCRTCDPRYGDEGLTAARCEVHPKELDDFAFRTVVLDEAHRVKDPTSKQTRAVWYVMHRPSVTRRWAMTGTAIASDPSDLWPIMHAVLPLEYPVRGDYVNRYCLAETNPFGGTDFVGLRPDTREEFFKVLDPHFRRMIKQVVLPQLPPRVRTTRRVALSPTMRKIYDELDAGLQARVEDGGLLVASNHLVKNLRLMQCACAGVDVDRVDPNDVSTWRVSLREPSPKLDELELTLQDLGVLHRGQRRAPVLVAAQFKQLLRMASRRLEKIGVNHAVIDGDVSQRDRERALDALREGTIRALLFTGQAGGTGLDMSAADALINLQRSWSLIDERQKEDRNHRIGSEVHESIQVIDIVTEGTVEERQVEVLAEKFQRLDEINRDRAALARLGADTSALDAEEMRLLQTDVIAEVERRLRGETE